MQFGLRNAALAFQRLMDRLFVHLPAVFVYLNDNLIASVAVPHHFYAAPARTPGKNFDAAPVAPAAPAALAPVPTLLCSKEKLLKRTKV
jgi:hypothetical protein